MALRERLQDLIQSYGGDLSDEHSDDLIGRLVRLIETEDQAYTLADGRPGAEGVSANTWLAADGPTEQVAPPYLPTDEITQQNQVWLDRYEVIGLLGSGGMGTVWRVRDRLLNRVVALKQVADTATALQRSRFYQEAQATAQLEHPGIVPVYDYGALEDGSFYYTMKVVHGRTLAELIAELHDASTAQSYEAGLNGITFRRLIAAFLAVCEAMAFAHDRGVIHRDLKPANVMYGSYGQTMVVDWGLAKVLGQPESGADQGAVVFTHRSVSADSTSWGTVAGTPHYMPPEQARGDLADLSPASDVWSLGAILYELLVGRTPFKSGTRVQVIARVLSKTPKRADQATRLPVPAQLADLVEACLQVDPSARPRNAGRVAVEVQAWLDGQRRRDQAMSLVRRAARLAPLSQEDLTRATELEARATELLSEVEPWQPVADKVGGWALEDEATRLRKRVASREQERLQLLRQAYMLAPTLTEANDALAAHYRMRHQRAEQDDQAARATDFEALLRQHNTGVHDRYLSGRSRMLIRTDPPGAHAVLHRFVERGRRLVTERLDDLGAAPVDRWLPKGSYLVELSAPGRQTARYPVFLQRGLPWDAVPPHQEEGEAVWLPPIGALGDEDIYVPAGWFRMGGDALAHAASPRADVWVDGFAIRRFAVTNAEYLDFLNALVDEGRAAEAEAAAPPSEVTGFHRSADGGYRLGNDPQGHPWLPDCPVVFVDAVCAHAYAAWRSAIDGLGWRLPSEAEWEKAARGVDGRVYPWGNFLDPTWTCVRGSREHGAGPARTTSFPLDRSPYGVMHMAGSVVEMVADAYRSDGPLVVEGRADATQSDERTQLFAGRGADWNGAPVLARVCTRFRLFKKRRGESMGFRLVRSLGP